MGEFDKPRQRLPILVIIGASLFTTIYGQFTFTGFPYARKDYRHTVTCSYPGATSYKWRFQGGDYDGAVYTFTVDSAKHVGEWACDAKVNGVTWATGKSYLSIYCDGVYVTSATTTNPSIDDPLDLSCKVLSPSGRRVQWSLTVPGSGNRKGIASVSNSGCEYYHTENDNIKFAPPTRCGSTSNQFFNLKIKKVSTSHEGYWTCYDFGKSGCYSKPLRIAIAKPPKNPPTLTGFDNPIVGTNHSLTCNAWQLDVRPLTYTWYKDGVQISSGNTSTWRLQPVKKEANGRYRCEVVDEVKNLTAKAEETLTVYYVAAWNPALEKKEAYHVRAGQSVNLTLNILAYPLLISIDLFAEEIDNSTSVNFTTSKASDTTWIVTIPNVQEKDYGNYTTNVTNAAGSTLFSFQIKPPSKPDVPSDLKALKLKDTNALAVTFKIGSDGGAPQNFTIEYNVKGEEKMGYIRGIEAPLDTKTVTQDITNLRSDTLYQIKVKAINEIGESNYSDKTEAKTEAAEMPVWQIVIIALVVLVLLIAIFLVIFFVARKKYKEVPEDAKGRGWKKRPVSAFVPAGVNMVETTDEGVENPIMVIVDDKDLEKIEPVEDIPVSRRFYHELNARAKTREARKSMASPFVKSELAPVAEAEEANGGNASHEYSMVDFRNKTKHKNQENDRQSKVASKLYAAVDFAKRRLRKDSNTVDEKTDTKQKTPPNVGVDGTLYAEVTVARNRPPTGNKSKARSRRKPEEQLPYGQVDFERSAPKVGTQEFEMI